MAKRPFPGGNGRPDYRCQVPLSWKRLVLRLGGVGRSGKPFQRVEKRL